MYIPPANLISDPETIHAFMRRHSFATLITAPAGAPWATHLPFIHRAGTGHGTLASHMARANSQWRDFDGQEVLVIFSGPHAYVSPRWYSTQPAVPTWNYAAVHAYGRARLVEDPAAVRRMLEEMISFFEGPCPAPWDGVMPEEFLEKMMRGIVAFEIPLDRLEAKFKLSQNRSPADVHGVIHALAQSADSQETAIAEMMAQHYPGSLG